MLTIMSMQRKSYNLIENLALARLYRGDLSALSHADSTEATVQLCVLQITDSNAKQFQSTDTQILYLLLPWINTFHTYFNFPDVQMCLFTEHLLSAL